MIIFSSHHMPTSQSYPNIKCIIQMIDTDSYINIACIIAKRTILSHLNVNSLYNEYKNNYMGPLFTIWIEEIYRICTNKKPFSCAYWSPLTQDLLLSSACVCLCLVVIYKNVYVNDPLMWAHKWFCYQAIYILLYKKCNIV